MSQPSSIAGAPAGRETPERSLRRLLDGHEVLIEAARRTARLAAAEGDEGSSDLLVGHVLRANETRGCAPCRGSMRFDDPPPCSEGKAAHLPVMDLDPTTSETPFECARQARRGLSCRRRRGCVR